MKTISTAKPAKALHQGFRDGCAMPNWHQALPSLHHLPSWLHHRSARWDPTLSCKYQVPQVAKSATCGIHNISISHKSLAQEQRAQRKEVRQVNLFEKTRAPPAKKIQLLGFDLHGLSCEQLGSRRKTFSSRLRTSTRSRAGSFSNSQTASL